MSDKYYMKDYSLSNERIAELEKLHRGLRDKRQADRLKAVVGLAKGWSAAQVGRFCSLMRRHPAIISGN